MNHSQLKRSETITRQNESKRPLRRYKHQYETNKARKLRDANEIKILECFQQ
jgi:hypothetical protein